VARSGSEGECVTASLLLRSALLPSPSLHLCAQSALVVQLCSVCAG
jgi:hypothetical protein